MAARLSALVKRSWLSSLSTRLRAKVDAMLLALSLFLAAAVLIAAGAATRPLLLAVTAMVVAVVTVAGRRLTYAVFKPLEELACAADALPSGHGQPPAPAVGLDEVGRLSASLAAMRQTVARSTGEIEEVNQQLRRRNEDLSVLNAMATAVSRSLELEDILHGALDNVLQLMQLKAGWVFLLDPTTGRLMLAASAGFSEPPESYDLASASEHCTCRQAMDTGRAHIVDDIPGCLYRSRDTLEREGPLFHASVPLKSKERSWGVLGVAFPPVRCLAGDELQLLTSIGHQIGVAIENARLYEELRSKELASQRLLDKLFGAYEEERARIARELHDGPGQSLTALLMQLGNLDELLPEDAIAAKQHVGEVETLTSGIVEEIRRLMKDLRPVLLDELGLIPAIRSYAETHLAPSDVEVCVQVDGVRRPLPPAVEIALFRVVQEALTNVAKHAAATRVMVRLCFGDDAVAVTIRDDGRGFDPVQSRRNWNAFGLLGLEERIALLGGSLRIESQPGRGTELALQIPTPGVHVP